MLIGQNQFLVAPVVLVAFPVQPLRQQLVLLQLLHQHLGGSAARAGRQVAGDEEVELRLDQRHRAPGRRGLGHGRARGGRGRAKRAGRAEA